MKTDELREKYLEFFTSQGHRLCRSDVLVPTWDKSVLFTPAGMNPFKDHFLGNVELEFTRATSCQKCLRTGDIENVGRTAYHHTFFEMLGNFSFGDYFKRDAIHWAWQFLTEKRWLGIDPEKLTVTVYLDDDEAARIWQNDIGLPSERIQRLDEYENFWPAGAPSDGPDGVCGPCSEIYFHPGGIGKGKEVEIWNLVFTQFNRSGDPPNNLQPLPNRNIDTGMGLERAASVLQGVDTNFHIDTLRPIVDAAAEISGMRYDPASNNGRFLRRITDHIRACTFAIHENVYPGPSKAEYVVRRLLRRCTLEGRQLGRTEPFLYRLVPAVISAMARPYPELANSAERIQQVIRNEEEKFLNTLDDGLNRIERIFESMKLANRVTVDGAEAADLYQTFGIPPELVESIASDRNCQFDWAGFKSAMEEHGEKSGKIADTVMGNFGPIDQIKRETKSTRFLGYESCDADCKVVGLVDDGAVVKSFSCNDASELSIVLDQTPFYAESGGQVADSGTICGSAGEFAVSDVQKNGDIFVHHGQMVAGTISLGEIVTATVDAERRDAIRRAHTATHILHYCLQLTLGSHAQQRGSKVADDWLRFDFSNLQGVSEENLAAIEQNSKLRIAEAQDVSATVVSLSEAKTAGAMMLFGEKYPDPVRMISIGKFSKELCGGTHLANSSDIGDFEIIAEESVSSGTRRIEALTGKKAQRNQNNVIEAASRLCQLFGVGESQLYRSFDQQFQKNKELKKQLAAGQKGSTDTASVVGGSELDYFSKRKVIRSIARALNVGTENVVDRVRAMVDESNRLEQQLTELDSVELIDAASLLGLAESLNGIDVIVCELPRSNSHLMRQLIDQVRKKRDPVAIFLATTLPDEKVLLVAGVSRDLIDRGIKAGDWVKEIAPIVGGGGGGKPELAQAGGNQPQNISKALQAARNFFAATVT